jgi:molybdopterin-guanine dinucleotide biosynthesis protein A
MPYPCSAVIVSGGLNTRFSGKEKAWIEVSGQRIMDRIYTVLKELFDEIIVVTNNPLGFAGWDLLIVTDLVNVRSSLTGIHAGLFYMTQPYGFFTACDAPFLNPDLIKLLLQEITPQADMVIPETSAGLEPLCAVYSKQCLKPAESHLAQNKLKIQLAFRKCRLKRVREQKLREVDPSLLSFFNVNTPADLARAEEIIRGRPPA